MVGFNNKFKRHPSIPADDYFAELSVATINLHEPVYQKALEHTEHGNETFPNLSLGDLDTFWRSLKQDVVYPTGEPLDLGVITYMKREQKRRKSVIEPTGLTLEPAQIRPDSSNFVVETIKTTVNDANTRLDDQIEYDEIVTSFQELLTAATKYSDLKEEDLPLIPTDAEYEKAVQDNEDITVVPRGLSDNYLAEATERDVEQDTGNSERQTEVVAVQQARPAPAATPLENNESGTDTLPETPSAASNPEMPGQESTGGFVPGVPEVSTSTDQVKADAPQVPMPPAAPSTNGSDSPTNDLENTPAASFKTKPVHVTARDPLLQRTDNFHLEVPTFNYDDDLTKLSLAPSDKNYVASELAKEQKQANTFMIAIGKKYEATIKEKLLGLANTDEFRDKVKKIVDSDWQEVLKDKITTEIQKQSNELYDVAVKRAEREYKSKVTDENARHEREIQRLEEELENQTENLATSYKQQAKSDIVAEQTRQIEEQQLYIDNQIQVLMRSVLDEIDKKSVDLVNTLQPQAIDGLSAVFNDIKKKLNVTKSELKQAHDEAVTQELAVSKQNVSEVNVKEQQELVSTLRNSEAGLSKKVAELSSQVTQIGEENSHLNAELEEMRHRATVAEARSQEMMSDSKRTEQSDVLTAFLLNQSMPKEQPKSSVGKYVLGVGLSLVCMGALALGGFVYTQNQQQKFETYKTQMQSKEKEHAKQIDRLKNSEDKSSQASSKQDAEFSTLDASIKSGSLAVYNESFKDKDLKTEPRTLAVGKLLLEKGNKDDAWSLAHANEGHNSKLVELLSQSD